jgi:hypothetical protein
MLGRGRLILDPLARATSSGTLMTTARSSVLSARMPASVGLFHSAGEAVQDEAAATDVHRGQALGHHGGAWEPPRLDRVFPDLGQREGRS